MLKVERKKGGREGVRQVVMRERIPPVDPGVVLIAELYVIYHMAVGSDGASESLFSGQPVPKHVIKPLDHHVSTHSHQVLLKQGPTHRGYLGQFRILLPEHRPSNWVLGPYRINIILVVYHNKKIPNVGS